MTSNIFKQLHCLEKKQFSRNGLYFIAKANIIQEVCNPINQFLSICKSFSVHLQLETFQTIKRKNTLNRECSGNYDPFHLTSLNDFSCDKFFC